MEGSGKWGQTAVSTAAWENATFRIVAGHSGQSPLSAHLFINYAAGDTGSGVAGWVGLQIVGFFVNDEGVAEYGVVVVVHVYARVCDGLFRFAFGVDGEVGHVAGVRAVGIVEAMLLAVGIEMALGSGERRLANSTLMDVERVVARRQVHEVDLDGDASSTLDFGDDGGAHALSFRVFHFDCDGFGGSQGRSGKQGCEAEGTKCFDRHGNSVQEEGVRRQGAKKGVRSQETGVRMR